MTAAVTAAAGDAAGLVLVAVTVVLLVERELLGLLAQPWSDGMRARIGVALPPLLLTSALVVVGRLWEAA